MVKRVPVPLRDRLEDFCRGPLAVMVWVVGAICAGWLLLRQADTFEYRGMARLREHIVASPTPGQLDSLEVVLFQDVEAGQVLATLNSEALEARLRTSRTEIERLSAQVEAERSRLALEGREVLADRALAERRLILDEERRLLDGLAIEVEIASDRIRYDRLGVREVRQRGLLGTGVVSQQDLDDIELRRRELEKRIEGNEKLLAGLQDTYGKASQRHAAYERDQAAPRVDESFLQPLRQAVLVQESLFDELIREREELTLVAPVAGRVSAVLSSPGAVLAFAQPVVVVVEREPGEVVVYQPESDTRVLRSGDSCSIARLSHPLERAGVRVTRIAPAVEELPKRLWADPNRPEYGRPFVLPLPDGFALAPGERVGVWLDR